MRDAEIPRMEEYPFEVRPLAAKDGGGFLILFPDLPGCMSDGETPEQAVANGRDAFKAWMLAHMGDGRPLPAPGSRFPAGPAPVPGSRDPARKRA
jgi:antitoxin HicB